MPMSPVETLEVFKGKSVTPGSNLIVDTGFPMGSLYDRLDLFVHVTLTQTTASGAVANGLLKLLKNIVFRGGNDHFVKNVGAFPLFRLAQIQAGTLPGMDTWATTTATTYTVQVPILFADPRMDFPVDTAIDTRRYKNEGFHFEMQCGTVADLLGTVGDSAITVTADMVATVEAGNLPPEGGTGMPKMYREYSQPAPLNPASYTTIDLERNAKMFLRRIFLQAANSATAGSPWTGTPANTILTDLYLDSNIRRHFAQQPEQNIRWNNKTKYGLETALTSEYVLDFVQKNSNFGAFPTDPQTLSLLQLKWTNNTLSTSQISTCIDAVRLY